VMLRYLGAGDGERQARELVGQRVAQLLLRRLDAVRVEPVQDLDATPRGEGGFGSTGS
jgi:dUTPase